MAENDQKYAFGGYGLDPFASHRDDEWNCGVTASNGEVYYALCQTLGLSCADEDYPTESPTFTPIVEPLTCQKVAVTYAGTEGVTFDQEMLFSLKAGEINDLSWYTDDTGLTSLSWTENSCSVVSLTGCETVAATRFDLQQEKCEDLAVYMNSDGLFLFFDGVNGLWSVGTVLCSPDIADIWMYEERRARGEPFDGAATSWFCWSDLANDYTEPDITASCEIFSHHWAITAQDDQKYAFGGLGAHPFSNHEDSEWQCEASNGGVTFYDFCHDTLDVSCVEEGGTKFPTTTPTAAPSNTPTAAPTITSTDAPNAAPPLCKTIHVDYDGAQPIAFH